MHTDIRDDDVAAIFAPVRRFQPSPVLDQRLAYRLRAFRATLSQEGLDDGPENVRTLGRPRGRILTWMIGGGGGLIAATVLLAVLLMSIGSVPAWAEVVEKLQSLEWIHLDGKSTDGTRLEYWVNLKRKSLAVKWNGTVFFDDTESRIRYEFNPQRNVIERRPLGDTSGFYKGFSELFGSIAEGNDFAENKARINSHRIVVEQSLREVEVDGKNWIEFEFIFDDPQGAIAKSKSVYRVDPDSKLPVQLKKWSDLSSEDHYT
jgi:hypothetical protein